MFKTCQKSQCSLVPITSLTLKAATSSAKLYTVVILPHSDRLSSLGQLNMQNEQASFGTHSVSLKCTASGDSKKSLNDSKTLARESQFTPVREDLYTLCPSH